MANNLHEKNTECAAGTAYAILQAGGALGTNLGAIQTTLKAVLLLAAVAYTWPGYAQTDTYVAAYMGIKGTVSTYHFLELQQVRGRWVFPDFVYIDFAKSDYREAGAGAGLKTLQAKYLTLMNGAYFVAALGRAANDATYILPWALSTYQLAQRVGGEAYYLAYVPLNDSGIIQHVLEHVKLERDFGHFKLGAGYAGYESRSTPWRSRPFATTTLKAGRAGDFELWAQRVPHSSVQFQIRYVLDHTSQ